MWGLVELHAHGMRAQHAMVVALALPLGPAPSAGALGAAARALEVAAVPARRLKAAALEHGDVIPGGMRPPDTSPTSARRPASPPRAALRGR